MFKIIVITVGTHNHNYSFTYHFVTGVIPLSKKDINWIQPSSAKRTITAIPQVSFKQIFDSVRNKEKTKVN